jgi:hypothetical protein
MGAGATPNKPIRTIWPSSRTKPSWAATRKGIEDPTLATTCSITDEVVGAQDSRPRGPSPALGPQKGIRVASCIDKSVGLSLGSPDSHVRKGDFRHVRRYG